MDFSNRDNRPGQAAAPQQNTMPASNDRPAAKRGMNMKGGMFGKLGPIVMLFSVAIIAAALIIALVLNNGDDDSNNLESKLINRDQYQAVFLDSQDGQVYFGKMAVYNNDLYILSDIFYVRVENPIQPQGTEAQQPNISLAKLGNELHGPEDVMFIARDKVLYWENLKDDGQVVTAITNFKANGSQTPTPAPQQQTEDETDADSGAAGTQPEGTPAQNDTPTETETPTTTP